jgi:cell division transport system permease protein
MTWIETKRIIRSGFINFSRNGTVSLASVLVMTITLSVVTFLILSQAVLSTSLNSLQDKVDVNVYFVTGTEEGDIMTIKDNLEKLPEVASASYTSAEEALADFKERHASDYLTLQALEELDENPLGAVLAIKAKDPSQYESIAKFLEGDSALTSGGDKIVDKVNFYQNKVVIDRLQNIMDGARKLGIIVTIILVIISILITLNTIRLTIYMAREEIGVMRLVGAANRYIQGPFIIEGIIYGILASLITIALYFPITIWLGSRMSDFLGLNLFTYYMSNIFQIFIILFLAGSILGILASFFAIRKYLKK